MTKNCEDEDDGHLLLSACGQFIYFFHSISFSPSIGISKELSLSTTTTSSSSSCVVANYLTEQREQTEIQLVCLYFLLTSSQLAVEQQHFGGHSLFSNAANQWEWSWCCLHQAFHRNLFVGIMHYLSTWMSSTELVSVCHTRRSQSNGWVY